MKANKKGTILLTGATAALRGGANFCVLSPGELSRLIDVSLCSFPTFPPSQTILHLCLLCLRHQYQDKCIQECDDTNGRHLAILCSSV